MPRIVSDVVDRTHAELLQLATELAETDERLLYALIQARKSAGLKQRDVAELLGIKQSSVAAFERYDNDPRLSTIRRYALAVGARVEHRVTCPSWDGEWIQARETVPINYAVMAPAEAAAAQAPASWLRTDFAPAASTR